MTRNSPMAVDISSDDSCSATDDDECRSSKRPRPNGAIDQPSRELTFEGTVVKRAEMYQEYMKQLPIPINRPSVLPCTTWQGLAKSIKQFYGQPLHYLTNICLKKWDQLRIGSEDEHQPLHTIIHPSKAEISIWCMEEVHRRTTSNHKLSKLWLADPTHNAYIDPNRG
ncbi:hypothetical protein ACET3Z_004903 [Daucus carota]